LLWEKLAGKAATSSLIPPLTAGEIYLEAEAKGVSL